MQSAAPSSSAPRAGLRAGPVSYRDDPFTSLPLSGSPRSRSRDPGAPLPGHRPLLLSWPNPHLSPARTSSFTRLLPGTRVPDRRRPLLLPPVLTFLRLSPQPTPSHTQSLGPGPFFLSELWTLSPCVLNPFASGTTFLKAKPPPQLLFSLLSVGLEPSPILSEDQHSILSRRSLIPFHPSPPPLPLLPPPLPLLPPPLLRSPPSPFHCLPSSPPPPHPLGPKSPHLTLPPIPLLRREPSTGWVAARVGGHPPWGALPNPRGSMAVGCACPREGPPWWVTRGWGCHVCVRWVGFWERCVYHILVSGGQCGFPLASPPPPRACWSPHCWL